MSIRKKNKTVSQDTAVNKDTTVSSEHEKLSKRYSKIQEADYFPYVPPSQTVTQSDLENLFAPPISLGIPKEERKTPSEFASDSAFAGGFNAFYESLTAHAINLGQYPMTSFVGYGVLQQIAQNGMIRTCIQTVADDMCREWIQVTGGDEVESDVLVKLQDLQESKYKLRSMFNKALAIVGFMGGAFIFIDTGTEDLTLPLNVSDKSAELEKGKNIRLVVVDPVNVSPGPYNASNPLADDYLDPSSWFVLGKPVHASRLIKLVDNEPPLLLKPAYNFLGIPQAQILWDYVLHWNKARETGVSILDKLNLTVFKTNFSEVMDFGGVQALDSKMKLLQRYRNNDAIFACDSAESVENITLTISGVVDIIRQALEFIAAINRTPAVKLLGIAPSGFNATGQSDIRNYYDHIKSKQEINRDAIQTLLNVIQICEFGHIDPSISFTFNELGEEDSTAKAMTAKTKVDMASVLQDRNVISAEEVREYVRRDQDIVLDFLSPELPEEVEGDLMTDDPSSMNGGMEDFLNQRNAPQDSKVDVENTDKAGDIS